MAEWLAVVLITFFAVISPGPDFVLVSRNSLIVSRRAGLLTAFGIGLGVLFHVTYTLLGIGVLIETSPVLFSLMKIAGAAYLVWLGLQMLRAKPSHTVESEPANGLNDLQAFRVGFTTNALNPKTMIFIVSLFMQVIEPMTPLSTRLGYGAFASIAHIAWFGLVATFLAAPHVRMPLERVKHWIDRGFGTLLVVFGVGLFIFQRAG